MIEYTFVTIYTLVDLGDGCSSLIDGSGNITTIANLARLVDTVMAFSYPFVTRVESNEVDMSTSKNKSYYKMPDWSNTQTMYSFKFTVHSIDVDALRARLHALPIVIPTVINDTTIRRFNTSGPMRNTTIVCNAFA